MSCAAGTALAPRVAPARPIGRRSQGRSAAARRTAAAAAAAKPAVVILPGLGNCSEDYDAFKLELESRGFCATVARVIRPDWLRNAAGLTSLSYWKGTLEPRPTVDWYLSRIADAVKEAKETSGASRVTIVAHSAGGWMARVYLKDFGVEDVAGLVSLGSPLNAVPKDVPGVVDQTRGILTYVEANCAPPAELGIPVTCLAGKWLEGVEEFDGVADAGRFLVGQGYKQVCGTAASWGDGGEKRPFHPRRARCTRSISEPRARGFTEKDLRGISLRGARKLAACAVLKRSLLSVRASVNDGTAGCARRGAKCRALAHPPDVHARTQTKKNQKSSACVAPTARHYACVYGALGWGG